MEVKRVLALVIALPVALALSIDLVHVEGLDAWLYFSDNDNPVSMYEANITVSNATHSLLFAMSVVKDGAGKYHAYKRLSLPYGIYDTSFSISNSTHRVSIKSQEYVVHKPGSNFRIVFNVSVSSDPSFDSSYFMGSSAGSGEARYMYTGKDYVFALVFPLSPASLERTPYSIMSVNSSIIYISFGNISSRLEGFAARPGISISPVRGSGKYRVVLARDDVDVQSEFCSAGERKIVIENLGGDGKDTIRVKCI